MLKPTVDLREDIQSRSSLGLIPVDQMDGKECLSKFLSQNENVPCTVTKETRKIRCSKVQKRDKQIQSVHQ